MRSTGVSRCWAILLLLALVSLMVNVGMAQDYRAKIQGTVTDPSQGAVVGATVTLKNVNTGVENVKTTDAAGHYIFDFVQPGTYNVTVVAAGFQNFSQQNIVAQTRGDVTVNCPLSVTGVTESISVTGEVNLVEFNTSTMTTTVQGSYLKDLPVLARNPFTLALLNPAVVNQYWDVSHRNPFYMWSNGGMDIGGPTGGKNDQELDGTSLNISARGSYNASMDAVQEVAIQQNTPDAEYGFSAGGTLNLSMKSGSNDIHGTAFYFGRNPALNAMANRITRDEQLVKQNIYGGTVGHPIIKNKLFNFGSFEQWRATQPSSTQRTLPTAAEKTGDFSQSLTPQGALRTIYDPLTTQFDAATGTVTRQPFAGNRIPDARQDPTAKKIMGDLWAPNGPGVDPSGRNNFQKAYAWWLHYWNFSDRVDYNISDKWRMFGRYSRYQTRLDNPNWGGTIAVPSDNGGIMDAMNTAIDVLYTASAHTTIDARLGVTYMEDDYASGWAQVDPSVWGGLFPTNWYSNVISKSQGIYYPNFSFNGNGSNNTGIGGWWVVHGRSYNPTVAVTHDTGAHHIKFGWQMRYSYDQDNASAGPGTLNFHSVDTGKSYLGYDATQSGHMYASALLGVLDNPDNGSGGYARIAPDLDMHQQQWGLYVQDDYKLNRNITLNLGLRWERETAPLEERRMLVRTMDLTNPIPELQGITMPSAVTAIAQIPYKFNGAMVYTSDSQKRLYDAPWKTFLPRAGVAFRINDQTAFRAGYARYAVQWITIHPETGGLPTNGFSQSTNVLGPLQGIPRAYVSDPFPSTNPVMAPQGNSLGRYTDLGNGISFWDGNVMKTPLNDRFNFTFQRQAPHKIFTEATVFMMFSHNAQDPSMWGGHYDWNYNQMDPNLSYTYKGALDQLVANPFYGLPANIMPGSLRNQPQVSVGSLLKPYPQYGDLNIYGWPGASDHYYSLQLKAERPMTNGLTFLVAYNYGIENHTDYYDDRDRYANKLTMFDRGRARHNMRIAGTWELPFGRGRQHLNNIHPVLDAIIGGWATSHIFMFRSGNLLNFDPAVVSGDPTANVPAGYYFNPAVFSVLPAYTPRSNPRYYDGLRGPKYWQLDSTLVKYFKITERIKFELRAEFYNMPNVFMPSDPGLGIGAGTMGQSTWVAGGNYGREMQYTGRIHF